MQDAVGKINSKVQVVEMEQADFRDYRSHLGRTYTERNEDTQKQPLKFSSAVWFNFGEGDQYIDGKIVHVSHPHEVWVSYDVKAEPQKVMYVKKRGAKFNEELLPQALYDNFPLPINSAKAKDVQELADNYVPSQYRSFYNNLPVTDVND